MLPEEKLALVQLVQRWLDQSHLKINQVIIRLQLYGNDLSRSQFENRFIRSDRFPMIEPDLIIAMVAVFRENLPESDRCSATEALEFARLTRLPIDRFGELGQFFPDAEFEPAYRHYLLSGPTTKFTPPPEAIILDYQPRADLSRANDSQLIPLEHLMPLYSRDRLHTYETGSVIFYCQHNKYLFKIPSQRTYTLNCQDEGDPYYAGQLPHLLNEGDVLPPPTSSASSPSSDKSTLNALQLSPLARASFWTYHHYHRQNWPAALAWLSDLGSLLPPSALYYYQLLGDVCLARGEPQAAKDAYEILLDKAKAKASLVVIEDIAYLGLAVVAYTTGQDPAEIRAYIEAVQSAEYAFLKSRLLEVLPSKITTSPNLPLYQGVLDVQAFTRFLAAAIAPELENQIKSLPTSLFDRLAHISEDLTLKSNPSWAWSLGTGDLGRAIETLASTYIVTGHLQTHFSGTDLSALPTSDQTKLLAEIQTLVREKIGLDSEQAQSFAEAYLSLIVRNAAILDDLPASDPDG